MKITADVIAHTALGLLDEVGLDGLTMRLVAAKLGVQAPALYWHVKNKQRLLDAMADAMFAEAVDRLESPRLDEPWEDWLAAHARRIRAAMLRYRDGARVFAGTHIADPGMPRTVELTLRTLQDAGFSLVDAGRGVATVLHYTVGYTIEEQARQGTGYGDDNPYQPDRVAAVFDPERYPLAARAATEVFFEADGDAGFEHGLRLLLSGMGLALDRGPRKAKRGRA
jgi:TetR/AcrR family tetracycline transcriptional repressor